MSASTRLPAEVITGQPWALLRSTLDIAVHAITTESPLAVTPTEAVEPRRQGAIAVLPIHGVIEHRPSLFGALMGGTSVEAIAADLEDAMADPDISAIVLDVDSPGGGVTGITELAGAIRSARERKPIVAVATGTAASAAYWLATQASSLYATPSGSVGSVGVYAVHQDISGALESEGISTTVISAGEHKTEGNELEPLSDDARAQMQRRVDAHYASFIGDVAKGRRTTKATVRDDYGQGRTFLAAEALEAGMVDHVGTLSDAIRQTARDMRSGARAEQEADDERTPFSTRVHAMTTDLGALVAHAQVRAELRDREHRPAFSHDIEASLRSIRDDALALADLLPDEPEQDPPDEPAPATPPADEPPAVATPPPPRPRFTDRAAWLAYLTGETRT